MSKNFEFSICVEKTKYGHCHAQNTILVSKIDALSRLSRYRIFGVEICKGTIRANFQKKIFFSTTTRPILFVFFFDNSTHVTLHFEYFSKIIG